jgi:hypothetical protein
MRAVLGGNICGELETTTSKEEEGGKILEAKTVQIIR